MPPAFDDNASFPRSHSSPNIPRLVSLEYRRPTAGQDDNLLRSASFSCLPALEGQYKSGSTIHNISADQPERKPPTKLSKEERPNPDRVGRRKSLAARPKSWIGRVKRSPERQNPTGLASTTSTDAPPVPSTPKATGDTKAKLVSGAFATFARKSWINSSRSPSPSRNPGKEANRDEEHTAESGAPTQKLQSHVSDSPPTLLPQGTTLQKTKQRPQSGLINLTSFASANSSTSSLPRSSSDNRSTPRTSTDKVPVPKLLSADIAQNLGIETPRRRDELWPAFRSLENDFSKFQAKSWSLKTNVVRASLLPFLRNHAYHPSNENLRPQDLDRRVSILNKWWIGLLEVLDGRQNQIVSGVDRPILLEACSAIMARPEWRLPRSNSAAVSDGSGDQYIVHRSITVKTSSGSLNASASQFMAESVHHNARTLFIQNLLSQMSFVVDKMSMRHAPASLVSFCGKATAYAFFFVPGVAEALVRIWKLPVDAIRRVADELGMPKLSNEHKVDDVVAPFPSHIHCLCWTNTKAMAKQLLQKPNLPVMAAKIPWYGPWVGRWCGRDSDLLFVMVKHYHILVEEFLPSALPLVRKARAPGIHSSFSIPKQGDAR